MPLGPLAQLTCAASYLSATQNCVNREKIQYHCGKSSIPSVSLPLKGLGAWQVAVGVSVVVVSIAAIGIICYFDMVKEQLQIAKKLVDDQCAYAQKTKDPNATTVCTSLQKQLVESATEQAKTSAALPGSVGNEIGKYLGIAALVYLGFLMLPTIVSKIGEARRVR